MSGRRHAPLLSRPAFFLRLLRGVLLATGLVAFSLGIGIVGYHVFSGLGWVDATLNASMILTGMGPVDPMRTKGAKLFASAYALFSGVAFLTMAALLFAPVMHRFLHPLSPGVGGRGRRRAESSSSGAGKVSARSQTLIIHQKGGF